MVDIDIIKETYARMADEQLITLARTDGMEITHEAFLALKKEFRKRNLDALIIQDIEGKRIDQSKEKILGNIEKEIAALNQSLWDFMLQEKYEAKTNEEITESLVQKGISQEASSGAVEELESVARKTSRKIKRNLLLFALMVAGLIGISILGYYSENGWYLIIITVISFIRMIRPFLKLLSADDRFEKIIKNIEKEKNQ